MRALKVLIVEDDAMVAQMNRREVESLQGFEVVGIARNADEARRMLGKHEVDLVLLDVYMPGESGIDLLRSLRRWGYRADVILVTADNSGPDVEEALRLGAVDYLVKPFELARLRSALIRYARRKERLWSSRSVSQRDIDELLLSDEEQVPDRRGIDRRTAEKILEALKGIEGPASADEVARAMGISRVTAKKYLDYLEEQGLARSSIQYKGTGRPLTLYRAT